MAYRDEVLADSPITYLSLDGGDTAIDVSGNELNGSVVDGNYVLDATLQSVGGVGEYALEMNGKAYIQIENVGPIIADDSFTVEMVLVRAPDHTSYEALWAMHNAAGDDFLVCWEPNTSSAQWKLPAETNKREGSFPSVFYEHVGERIHYVTIYDRDASAVRVFINGEEVLSTRYPIVTVTPPVPENAQLVFGMQLNGSSPSNFTESGVISQVAVYKGALSAERIAAHFAATSKPVLLASIASGWVGPVAGWNPSSNPVPNPRGIERTGRSLYLNGPGHQLATLDQMDGGGGNGTPTGGVSDPSRMGVIAGTVLDIQAQPVSRRVRVHERATGRIVRETWSDADGKYRFTDLDPRRAFYVMAFDHTLQQNAVVSDNVHSEVEDSP